MRVEDLIRGMEAGEALTPEQLGAVRRGELEANAEQGRPEELRRLAHFVAKHGHVDVLTALVESADPAVQASLVALDGQGQTPAHMAARIGRVDVLNALGASADPAVRASVEAVHREGRTPAHFAAAVGDLARLHALGTSADPAVQASLAAPDREGHTPAHLAALNGRVAVLTLLGESINPAFRASLAALDGQRRTPAHLAALNGHVAVLTALGASADPAVRASLAASDREGWTPAHFAALNDRVAVLNALGESTDQAVRVSLAALDGLGRTPAHWAALNGHVDVLFALGESTDPAVRASLRVPDLEGRTPEQLAIQRGHGDVVEALSPGALSLKRAVADLESDGGEDAQNLLTELQCPVHQSNYRTVGKMRPVYMLRAGEGAAVGTPMPQHISAAAVEEIVLRLRGQEYAVNPMTREPFDGHTDARDQIQLMRQVAQAYEHNPKNLPAARAAALAVYAAHGEARAAGQAGPDAAPNADAPARGAGPVPYGDLLARQAQAAQPHGGAAPAQGAAGRGGPQP